MFPCQPFGGLSLVQTGARDAQLLLGSVGISKGYGLAINEVGELLAGDYFGNAIHKCDLDLGNLGGFASTGTQFPTYMTVIPEPSRVLFMCVGFSGMVLRRRRALQFKP